MYKIKTKYNYLLLLIGILYVLALIVLYVYKTNYVYKIHDNTKKFSIINNVNFESLDEVDLFIKGDYISVIKNLENEELTNYDDKILLIESYLNYGNAYYNESEYSQKALSILNNMEDSFKVLFLKGYSNEIIKNYEEASKFYYKILELENLSDLEKGVVYNQIGHLTQLMGFFDLAYSYYTKAYEYNNENVSIILNIGRYLIHQGNLKEGKKYLELALSKTSNTFLKSEIYYGLSSISLYEEDYESVTDIYDRANISLDYSKKALESNENYPLAYVGYARALIMKNENLNEANEYLLKSINIYPNLSIAYKYLGYLKMNEKNYEEAINNFEISIGKLNNDITLMGYERDDNAELYFQIAFSYAKIGNKEKTLENIEKMINSKSKYVNNLFFSELLKENNGVFNLLKGDSYFENLLTLLNIN